MCRLFGAVAKKPIRIEPWLFEKENSILEQSNVHKDGWGIAYLKNKKFSIERSDTPAYDDGRFNALAHILQSNIFLVHIRKASVGEVKIENNQPFIRGKWVFAHNGTIEEYKMILSLINVACLRGNTDSEVFLQFLMKNMKTHSVVNAIKKSVTDASEITKYSSLNFIASDGNKLYALCEYTSESPSAIPRILRTHVSRCVESPIPKQLIRSAHDYTKEPFYYTMRYLKKNDSVLISSEYIGSEKWAEMNNHELIVIDKKCNLENILIL